MIELALLSNSSFTTVGISNGIARCVILNDGTPSVSAKTMACTAEAILGAVFLDGGADALERVITTLGLTHEFLPAVTVKILSFYLNMILENTAAGCSSLDTQ